MDFAIDALRALFAYQNTPCIIQAYLAYIILTLHSLWFSPTYVYTDFSDDFTTSPSSLMFEAGTMEDQALCTTVTVEGDNIEESKEQAVVRIQSGPFIVNGGTDTASDFAVITVVDNDSEAGK